MNSPRPPHGLSLRAMFGLVLIAMTVTAGAAGLAQNANAQVAPSMSFGVVFSRASYGNPELSYNTAAVESADLNMLLSTNAQCIRMDIGYQPWLQNDQAAIKEITSLVQDIKSAGKCLIIADAASESYRKGGQIPWSAFKTAWVSRVSTLAALFQPNYYIVVKEPGWYVPMVSDATTNPLFQNITDWLGLTQNLTKAVQAASPSTVIGVAIAANSLVQANGAFYAQYLNQVQSIPGISFIGFDVYGQSDQTAAQNYLSQNPPSKSVWIPEAWSTANGAALNGSPSQDVQWMEGLYSFASAIHATFCIPFYTDDFASYTLTANPPTNSAQIISLYGQREPVFSEFQSVIVASGAASITTSSSTSTASSSTSTNSTSQVSSVTTSTSSGAISSVSTVHTQTSSGGKRTFALVLVLLVVLLIAVVAAFLFLGRGPWSKRLNRRPRAEAGP
jgi:hypothetical protein